jgi:hypothetical protein
LILDIDGLRQDVFHRALAEGHKGHEGHEGHSPNLARLLGGVDAACGLHLDPLSPAPSITFAAQTTIFTGLPPGQHGIAGNEFFDRFGLRNDGKPRFYAFDVGDALAVEDAVEVFTGSTGLVGQILAPEVPTLYELAAAHGLTSLVVYNMIARGATHWIRPNLLDIARFTRGGGLLGISAEQYDTRMLDELIQRLRRAAFPDIVTAYFMGLDHHSHQHGPGAQLDYLARVVDPQIGRLIGELESGDRLSNLLAVVVSDHGQIGVIPDDRHSQRLGFPFDREMGHVFDALGLDVHDYPGEGPNCNALVACNGGLAYVYLRRRQAGWGEAPSFVDDVQRVASAFWRANQTGAYDPDLQGALAMILVRDCEQAGWQAPYKVFAPEGRPDGHPDRLVPLGEYLASHPEIETAEAVDRLDSLVGPMTGDLLLVSNYAGGFYFGAPITGIHGGLHPQESRSVLSLGWQGAGQEQVAALRQAAQAVVGQRPSTLADLVPLLKIIYGW